MKNIHSVIILSLLCLGCAQREFEVERVPTWQVDGVESVEQQAASEVDKMPLKFYVSIPDDVSAWSRAQTFLNMYASPLGAEINARGSRLTSVVSGKSKSGNYFYEIEKMNAAGGGFTYKVECQSSSISADPRNAQRNARNLARFIASGTLERSLLSE